jgi:hypothetical protein
VKLGNSVWYPGVTKPGRLATAGERLDRKASLRGVLTRERIRIALPHRLAGAPHRGRGDYPVIVPQRAHRGAIILAATRLTARTPEDGRGLYFSLDRINGRDGGLRTPPLGSLSHLLPVKRCPGRDQRIARECGIRAPRPRSRRRSGCAATAPPNAPARPRSARAPVPASR